MNTASKKPTTRHSISKVAPKATMLCSDTCQRSVVNSRSYCVIPTKSERGSIFDEVNDMPTDHSTVPR